MTDLAYKALLADPTVPVERAVREAAIRDLKRPSRRYLLPGIRIVSFVSVFLIVTLKRVLPFQWSGHVTLDRLCRWFCRRFVSPEACGHLIRHFVVETKLINFVLRNAGDPDLSLCELEPRSIDALGADKCVVAHDVNIHEFVIAIGESERADVVTPRPLSELDFSDLEVGPVDPEPDRRRWINLDIESSLYLMNIPFAFFTKEDEYEMAVNSFQLDETLLACIANMTGDPVFRTWTPLRFAGWRSIRRDVPRDLFWHATVNEYAYARLCALARQARKAA